MMHSRIGKVAIVLIAVLTAGLMSFGTGLASFGDIDGGLGVFADKGGNGGGNGNGQDKDKDKDKGNQDEDNDANDESQNEDNDAESGDEGKNDNSNSGNGKSDNSSTDNQGGNKDATNRGQGHDKHADDEDSTPDADGTPTDDKNAKVGICHVTGSDSNSTVYIEVSENAVPAHEAHGDVIGVASEDECSEGTPIPGDGTATPGATPEVVT